MSHIIAFDTHTYVKKLESAGWTESQAEIQADALMNIIDENLATKRDIELIRRDMKELENSLKRDMKELENSLKRDMKELELKFKGQFDILKWMMGAIIAGIFSLIMKTFFA